MCNALEEEQRQHREAQGYLALIRRELAGTRTAAGLCVCLCPTTEPLAARTEKGPEIQHQRLEYERMRDAQQQMAARLTLANERADDMAEEAEELRRETQKLTRENASLAAQGNDLAQQVRALLARLAGGQSGGRGAPVGTPSRLGSTPGSHGGGAGWLGTPSSSPYRTPAVCCFVGHIT